MPTPVSPSWERAGFGVTPHAQGHTSVSNCLKDNLFSPSVLSVSSAVNLRPESSSYLQPCRCAVHGSTSSPRTTPRRSKQLPPIPTFLPLCDLCVLCGESSLHGYGSPRSGFSGYENPLLTALSPEPYHHWHNYTENTARSGAHPGRIGKAVRVRRGSATVSGIWGRSPLSSCRWEGRGDENPPASQETCLNGR